MTTSTAERVRMGALLTGAIALGAGGVATAGKLIDSGDIKNGSIKEKDLSKSTKGKLNGRDSLLVSSITELPLGQTRYIAPGASEVSGLNNPNESELQVPDLPEKGFKVRGLTLRGIAGKGGRDSSVELFKNGSGTGLSCSIAEPAESCDTTGSVKVARGDRLTLEVSNESPFSGMTATITLSLQTR